MIWCDWIISKMMTIIVAAILTLQHEWNSPRCDCGLQLILVQPTILLFNTSSYFVIVWTRQCLPTHKVVSQDNREAVVVLQLGVAQQALQQIDHQLHRDRLLLPTTTTSGPMGTPSQLMPTRTTKTTACTPWTQQWLGKPTLASTEATTWPQQPQPLPSPSGLIQHTTRSVTFHP